MPLESSTLSSLRAKFDALVRGFDVHPDYKRFATFPTHDGGAHVEHHHLTYAYVVTERGRELKRRETSDPDEILYWLVSDTTWATAIQYELKHRVAGKDFRRLLFDKHVELLGDICTDWAERKRTEYAAVLTDYPFNDGT